MTVSQTATIRVPAETRDMLAEIAKWRGISLSAYLTALTKKEWREEMLASVRETALLDAQNPAAAAEYELWDETVGDGIE